jgi:hypothetical protein
MEECPKEKCWFWMKAGTMYAPGHYPSLDAALVELKPIKEEGCHCSWGRCTRLHPDGDGDFYEPALP